MNRGRQNNRAKGNLGEDLAAKALLGDGYEIIARNYQKRYGEIDIIAQKEQCLYFVEVKTRKSGEYGTPLESITPTKRQKIYRVAQNYLIEHPSDMDIGFLAVGILLLKNQQPKIEIIEDPFLEFA